MKLAVHEDVSRHRCLSRIKAACRDLTRDRARVFSSCRLLEEGVASTEEIARRAGSPALKPSSAHQIVKKARKILASLPVGRGLLRFGAERPGESFPLQQQAIRRLKGSDERGHRRDAAQPRPGSFGATTQIRLATWTDASECWPRRPMSRSREKVEALFEAAVALETEAQRADYLGRACPDPGLRREVESLLAAHRKPDRILAMKTIRLDPDLLESATEGGDPQIGGYRIIRTLGRGGMGTVYEAEEIESGRRVALKVLGQALDSPTARQRFLREGLLAASINHPNTVYVFGTEEIDGQPVIAMEMVRGGTLQDRVRKEAPMNVAEAVDAILQVIAGLEAAAARGILHRDIKPSNCFVETDGTVKVGDFGLSIASDGGGETKLTMTGSFLGTPAYSPPEQLRGDEFTIKGDIYAVGVTLYHLLTGRIPFEGENLVRMLATVLERPAESPAKLRPELPDGLCRSVVRCLEKQPAKRFKNYAELRNALLPFSSLAPNPATLSLRFLAGFIDWLLLKAAFVSINLLSTRNWDAFFHPSSYPGTSFNLAAVSGFLSLLYYAALEGLWGASIGKRICGLQVAGPNRGLPGVPRALLRATIADGLPALPTLLFWLLVYRSGSGADLPFWISDLVGVIWALLFCTARRRNGYAAVQDLVSRTRILRASVHQARPGLAAVEDLPPSVESAHQFGPYQVLETFESREDAQWLLAFDRQLQRKVWIRKLPPGAPPVEPALRNVARVGRLRWLNGRRSADQCWDAYEAGPGKPLLDLIDRRQPWNCVRFWLLDLAEEMTAAAKDLSLPAILELDRVWITADGRAKLLDFPAPLGGQRKRSPVAKGSGPDSSPQLFLSQVAVAALEGRAVTAQEAHPDTVAVPLPAHAREVLSELQSGISPGLLADRLKPLLSKLASVSIGRRQKALAGCFAFPLTVAALSVAFVVALAALCRIYPDTIALGQCLSRLADPRPVQESPGGKGGDTEDREAFEIYIAGRLRPMITNDATWTSLAGVTILRDQRTTAEKLIARRPAPSEFELKQASAVVEPYLENNSPLELVNPRGKLEPKILVYAVAWTLVFGGAVPSLLAALFFRGGLVLRTLGLMILKPNGTAASRLRIFWRSFIAWVPLLLMAMLATWLVSVSQAFSWKHAALMGIGFLPAVGLILWAALLPERGLQDRLAGTCLVPRE